MLFAKTILAALVASCAVATPVIQKRFPYGQTKVRGVNLGGWLLTEPFITPSLYQPYGGAAVDEYTLCQIAPDAESILRSHWESWVTQGDIQRIASSGFNLVRIPIGYWAFQKYRDDPYIPGAAEYLDRAIGWARQSGLQVWIDLHGAPASQNGFDNSGQRLDSPQWSGSYDSIQVTQDVIAQIAQKYGTDAYADVVAGIELLNEPMMAALPGGRGATQSYYQFGYDSLRAAGNQYAVIQDGFVEPYQWNGFLSGQGPAGAIVDHHEYQVFTKADVSLSPEDHVGAVWGKAQNWAQNSDKWVVVGEWSAAMTDCAYWLNGVGRGARYEGAYSDSYYVGSCEGKTGPASTWTPEWRQATTNYISAQMQAFDTYTQGWIFWNFKTEAAAEWSAFALIDAGIWPQA